MNHKYRLHHANPETFAKCESIYGDLDGVRFLTASATQRRVISLTGSDGTKEWAPLWITNDKRVVGGMLMKQAAICRLFFVPDFLERRELCSWIAEYLNVLNAYVGTLSLFDLSLDEVVLFEMLGYVKEKARIGMSMNKKEWYSKVNPCGNNIRLVGIEEKPQLSELVDFHVMTFSGHIDAHFYYQSFGVTPNHEVYENELLDWMQQLESKKTQSSVLAREVNTNKLIGICLVGEEDGISTLFSVGVIPPYQNKGIGKWMIQESLSRLFRREEICQLYVTVGNPAIHLYKKMGFKERCMFVKMTKCTST